MKFKPIEERFLHHTLVVVRSANVEHLIKSYNDSAKKDIRETGRVSIDSLVHVLVSSTY